MKKTLVKLTNTNELILINDENGMDAGSPYYTEYYECEDLEEMKSILSGKKQPNWKRLSESFYRDGDVLLSDTVDDLRKKNEELILIKDENGIEQLNNCEWNWESFYIFHDGNNHRAIQFEIEEDNDNINFEKIAELEIGQAFIDLVKINDVYYVAAQGNYGDSTTYIYSCDIISEDELTAEIAGEHTAIIKNGLVWKIEREI